MSPKFQRGDWLVTVESVDSVHGCIPAESKGYVVSSHADEVQVHTYAGGDYRSVTFQASQLRRIHRENS
jgi:hypothetical protein